MGKPYTFEISWEQAKMMLRGNPPENFERMLENAIDEERYEEAQMIKELIEENTIRLFVDGFYATYGNMMSKLANE